MSEVNPKDYYQVNRGFGNEFFVDDPSKAKVIKVVSVDQAKRIDREYHKKLPNSTAELKLIYQNAHS